MDGNMLPVPIVVCVAAILGALVGSFLNVCIARWPADESVVKPRSRCPQCKAPIAWYDNLPVLSWLMLRGRCRGCSKRISVQYPLVELATAGIWAYTAYQHGATVDALQWAVFGTILLGIAMTDAREYIIPDEFSLGGLVIGLGFSLISGWDGFVSALIGATVGFVTLASVGLIGAMALRAELVGAGVVKMAAFLGAFLGWQGVLLAIFLGALGGTIVYLPLSLVGRRDVVPFGLFLSLGAMAAYIFGDQVLMWYSGFLGV
jgi:leader peptidase (prepilin peptidase)/N-methyltransferase